MDVVEWVRPCVVFFKSFKGLFLRCFNVLFVFIRNPRVPIISNATHAVAAINPIDVVVNPGLVLFKFCLRSVNSGSVVVGKNSESVVPFFKSIFAHTQVQL